ncbi:MAG: sigma-70 family RNA polymerase sigma factor [Deltaproteobacteria bacterium]|nr:sigma-70 family RNA polymerase sigma factor [Deltaproteobacteria bacterium]
MIEPAARDDWRTLSEVLRPFVARRLPRTSDVDDVLQEVLLKVRRGHDQLRDPERFGPWVYRLAKNAIVDHQRQAQRWDQLGESSPEVDLVDPREPEDRLPARLAQVMTSLVESLPAPYREAVTLVELEGLTHAEAAARLGLSVSGMKSRVQRGRRMLRDTLEAACAIDLDLRGRVIACEPRAPGCSLGRAESGQASRCA